MNVIYYLSFSQRAPQQSCYYLLLYVYCYGSIQVQIQYLSNAYQMQSFSANAAYCLVDTHELL